MSAFERKAYQNGHDYNAAIKNFQLVKAASLISRRRSIRSSMPEKVPTAPQTVMASNQKAAINNGIVSIIAFPERNVPTRPTATP